MLPVARALKEKLLNEPVFFLSALAAGAVVVQQQVDLPGWVGPVAVVLFGLAQRATAVPVRKAREQRLRAARAARGAR